MDKLKYFRLFKLNLKWFLSYRVKFEEKKKHDFALKLNCKLKKKEWEEIDETQQTNKRNK